MELRKGEFIVEDTSLYFDCLGGLPGPLIKWFLATVGNEGLWNIAEKMENRKAEARTIIGHADKERVLYFEGVVKGNIVSPRGTLGFGWDVIFQPEGHEKTFAEMAKEEKNAISMRRIAFEKLKEFLGK